MPLFVLTGSDATALRARRAQLRSDAGVAVSSVEHFDLTEDSGDRLVAAATMFSLFGGDRFLSATPAAALSPQNAARLADVAQPDATVVVSGPAALTAALRKALAGAVIESFATPTPRDARARVAELARGHGVRLAPDAHTLLTGLAVTHWTLVCGVVTELAAAGLHNARAEDVSPLLGTAAPPPTPWGLADALEGGDLPKALAMVEHLEPVPAVAYLAKRIAQVGRLVDAGVTHPGEAETVLGIQGAGARTLLLLAKRLGTAGTGRSWDLLASADRAVKVSRQPSDVVTVLVCQLAGEWAPTLA